MCARTSLRVKKALIQTLFFNINIFSPRKPKKSQFLEKIFAKKKFCYSYDDRGKSMPGRAGWSVLGYFFSENLF